MGWTLTAFGQRSRKTAASVTTHYQYDPDGRLLAETNLQGTLLRQYVYFDDGQPFATYDGAKLAFLATDPIGMPMLAVDRSGATLWRNRYEAFGQSTPNATGLTLNLRYPGQYHDSETGLHYNLNRYYDPSLGRYLQADLIGLAGGVNTYAYVENNPIRYIDPLGLCLGGSCHGQDFMDWYNPNPYKSEPNSTAPPIVTVKESGIPANDPDYDDPCKAMLRNLKGLYLGIREATQKQGYDKKLLFDAVQRYKKERQIFIDECSCKGWGAPPDINPFNPLSD